MAQTLPNGTIIPQGSDVIDPSGVAEMRLLGGSVDAALAERLKVGDPSIATTARTVFDGWRELPSGASPNTINKPGWFRILQSGTYSQDMPSWWINGNPATLISFIDQFGWGHQEITLRGFSVRRAWRLKTKVNEWSPWFDYPTDAPTTIDGTGGQTRTTVELTGEYTNPADTQVYVNRLAAHRNVNTWSIGKTVEGRDIPAIRIGDPEKPAVLVVAGVHGNEMGCRDGAMVFARELAMSTSYLPLDLCMVIVPSVNLDGWGDRYGNANNVNINSDFIDKTQPETTALVNLINNRIFNFIAGIDIHNFGYSQQVSLRYPFEDGSAHPAVQAQAKAAHDAVWDAHVAAGNRVRDYEPSGSAGSLWRALGQQWALPSLLMEVPSYREDGGQGVSQWLNNPRMTEVHRVITGALAFAEYVRAHRDEVVAAKAAGLANPVPVVPIGD